MKKAIASTSGFEQEEPMTTDITQHDQTEEERVFKLFCDCVDSDLVWRGQPPIASTDEEKREKAMMVCFGPSRHSSGPDSWSTAWTFWRNFSMAM